MFLSKSSLVAALAAVPAMATASSASLVNVYFGQHGNDNLANVCDDHALEFITLAFVNVSPENGGAAGYPGTNFANHCWAGYYDKSKLLNTCPYLTPGIDFCQKKGKKILLSIGGELTATSNYTVSTPENGRAFADFLWGAFGPYDKSWGSQPRPFDYTDAYGNPVHVAMDGYDFDIESADAGIAGYQAMIERLRQLINKSGRLDIITGAPQCPLDEKYQPMLPLLKAVQFDRLWIQYYNNPGCAILDSAGKPNPGFNFAQWESLLNGTDSKSPNVKLHLGLPGSPDGAPAGGYVSPSVASSVLCSLQSTSSGLFAGLMLWDQTLAAGNVDKNGVSYTESLYESMRCSCGKCPSASPSSSVAHPSSTTISTIPSSSSARSISGLSTTTTTPATVSRPPFTSTVPTSTLTTRGDLTFSTAASSSVGPTRSSSTAASSSVGPTRSSSTAASSSVGPTRSSSTAASSSVGPTRSSSTAASSSVGPTRSSSTAASSSVGPTRSSSTAPHSSGDNASRTSTTLSTTTPPAVTNVATSTKGSSGSSSSVRLSTGTQTRSNATSTSGASHPSSTLASVSKLPTSSVVGTTSRTSSTGSGATTSGIHAGFTTLSSQTGAVPTSRGAGEVTQTIWTTTVSTITSCAASVTNCPAGTRYSTSSWVVTTSVVKASPTSSVDAQKGSATSSCGITATGSPTSARLSTTPSGTSPTSSQVQQITSTIWSIQVHTIKSCAPTVTSCADRVTTTSIPVSTTVLTRTATAPVQQWTTSTIYSTLVRTVSGGSATTQIIAVTTTVCPVNAAQGSSTSTSSPAKTGTALGSGSTSSSGSSPKSSSPASANNESGAPAPPKSPGAQSASSTSATTVVPVNVAIASPLATSSSGTLTVTRHVFNTLTVPRPTDSSAPKAVNNAGAAGSAVLSSGAGFTPVYYNGTATATATKTYSLSRVGPTQSASATSSFVTAGAERSVGGVGLAVVVGVVA